VTQRRERPVTGRRSRSPVRAVGPTESPGRCRRWAVWSAISTPGYTGIRLFDVGRRFFMRFGRPIFVRAISFP